MESIVGTYVNVQRALESSSKYLLGSVYDARFENDRRGRGDEEDDADDERDEEAQDDDLQSISAILARGTLDCPFMVAIDCTASLSLFQLNGASLPVDVEQLVQVCSPSPFGDLKTNETRVDLSVRKAFELRDGLDFTKEGRAFLFELCKYVSCFLFGGKQIALKLNKLNIYPVGGFFSRHIDTPKDGMLGTVVVELPYQRTGGNLFIQSPFDENGCPGESKPEEGKSHQEPEPGVNEQELELLEGNTSIIAFYGDCPHRISPVVSGHRVSITLYVLEASSAPTTTSSKTMDSKSETSVDGHNGDLANSETPLPNTGEMITGPSLSQWYDWAAFRGADGLQLEESQCSCTFFFPGRRTGDDVCSPAKNKKKKKQGNDASSAPAAGTRLYYETCATFLVDRIVNYCKSQEAENNDAVVLGILLSHKYSQTEHHRGTFKGMDAHLLDALRQRSPTLSIEVLPVVIRHHEQWWGDDGDNGDGEFEQDVYRFTEGDYAFLSRIPGASQPAAPARSDIQFLRGRDWKQMSRSESSYVEFAGNESEPGLLNSLYFANAVILTYREVTTVKPRKRKRASSPTA